MRWGYFFTSPRPPGYPLPRVSAFKNWGTLKLSELYVESSSANRCRNGVNNDRTGVLLEAPAESSTYLSFRILAEGAEGSLRNISKRVREEAKKCRIVMLRTSSPYRPQTAIGVIRVRCQLRDVGGRKQNE